MPIDLIATIVIIVVCIIIGLSKGGLGAALAVLCVPLLSLVMPITQAISLALPLLIVGDVFALWAFWRHWDHRLMGLMLLPAIIGILIGTYVLASLDEITLRRVMGIFVLVFVIYKLALEPRLQRLHYTPHDWHGRLAGAVSGFGSALANVGGPPFTMYLLLQKDITPVTFAGTATLFFAIVNVIKLPGLIAAQIFDLHDLLNAAWALPLIPLGVWIGRWGVHKLNRTQFDLIMLGVLTINALVLLFVQPGT
jgi:hypothetical protein